jgi:hypothetical protein
VENVCGKNVGKSEQSSLTPTLDINYICRAKINQMICKILKSQYLILKKYKETTFDLAQIEPFPAVEVPLRWS